MAGAAHEVFEQLEFPGNQVDQLAFVPDGSVDQVLFQIAHSEPDDADVAAQAQEDLDACRQFANIEWFGQIITAGFQSRDSFIEGGEPTEDQGGRPLSFAAQSLDDRKPVLAIQESIDDEDSHVVGTSRP